MDIPNQRSYAGKEYASWCFSQTAITGNGTIEAEEKVKNP
jgi:hypothetical protein